MFSFSSYISVVLHGLCTTRRTFSLYDQINLIDTVPEDQLRFQWYSEPPQRALGVPLLYLHIVDRSSLDFIIPLAFSVSPFNVAGSIGGYSCCQLCVASALLPYGDTGFTVNGVKYEGSLLVVEHKLMTWTPKTFSEITPESLSVFKILRPVPVFCFSEILILGCGRHIQPVSSQLQQFIRSTGMKLEAVDSRNAASTYNVLSEEGRPVAAALLPYGVAS
ncbi:hypothetical protein BHE74_00027378 [Ensete ventricosum]|nr:hypothetical protein BHE74_00027378 [Ensete ventricosum]